MGTAISLAQETNTSKMNEGNKISFTATSVETQYMGECCELTPSGVTTTFVGSGSVIWADGQGTSASFCSPNALTV